MVNKKQIYNFWTGLKKTFKNSAVLLIPFGLAMLAGVPVEYAWVIGPLTYFLKNVYEIRTNKKLV